MVKKVRVDPFVQPIEDYWRMGQAYPNPELKSLFYLLYLTAGRISEVLQVTSEDFIERDIDGEKVTFVRLINLKNKRRFFKEIPLLGKYGEQDMIDFVLSFISRKEGKIFKMTRQQATTSFRRYEILINVFDIQTKQIITDYPFKVYPHYLRKSRLTHLDRYYNFSPFDAKAIAGWTDIRPAVAYIEDSRPQDLVRKFKRG